MKRFQLCLCAVFMLLVSNCVAGSETALLPDGQKETPLATGGSSTDKKGSAPLGGTTGLQQAKEEKKTDNGDSKNTLAAQGDTQIKAPGAPGSAKGSSTTETQTGVKTSHGDPVVEGDAKDPKTGGNPSESSPATEGDTKETKAKDEHSKSAPATKDGVSDPKTGGKPSQDAPVLEGAAKDQTKGESPKKNAPATENTNTVPKAKDDTSKSAPATKDSASDPKTGGNPSEGAPVVAGTTAAPVAEGKPTEGNSGSASTSTHIPTDPAKGADSQASVKAGVLSFILSIGTVLAVFA